MLTRRRSSTVRYDFPANIDCDKPTVYEIYENVTSKIFRICTSTLNRYNTKGKREEIFNLYGASVTVWQVLTVGGVCTTLYSQDLRCKRFRELYFTNGTQPPNDKLTLEDWKVYESTRALLHESKDKPLLIRQTRDLQELQKEVSLWTGQPYPRS